MSVPQGFSDLMDISSQVEAAIVLEGDRVLASSIADESRSLNLAEAFRRLADEAAQAGADAGLKQLEVTLPEGNVFVVRDGARLIGATTGSDPASSLVLYDLRTCLTSLAEAEDAKAQTKPRRTRRSETTPYDAAR